MSQPSYIQPLSRGARWGVLASVILFHAGIGWALASVQPKALMLGDVASMEVRMVSAEQLRPEPPVQIDVPPPEDTPPPEVPQLESMIQPPMPDLPPPTFPVQAPPPKPPQPKPQPKPQPPKPQPQQAAPAQPTQPATTASPQTLSIFQISYSVRPVLIYPLRAQRAGQHGTTEIRAYVDANGVPQVVTVAKSSGYPLLDEAAVDAMRKARINTGGRVLWVTGPFEFKRRE